MLCPFRFQEIADHSLSNHTEVFRARHSKSMSESVKCRFSKCRFSVLNLDFDFISDGGCTREKQIQKALDSLPPCGNRCRFSESAICFSRVRPPSEIKSNFKFKTLRWRPLRWHLTLSDHGPHLLNQFPYYCSNIGNSESKSLIDHAGSCKSCNCEGKCYFGGPGRYHLS